MNGAQLVMARHFLVEALSDLAHSIHRELTSHEEGLEIMYHPSVGGESLVNGCQPEEIVALFQQALSLAREREMVRGMTLIGPHRDEIRFLVNKVDMGVYGSRGQQRTVAAAKDIDAALATLGLDQRLDDALDLAQRQMGQLHGARIVEEEAEDHIWKEHSRQGNHSDYHHCQARYVPAPCPGICGISAAKRLCSKSKVPTRNPRGPGGAMRAA